MDNKFKTEFLSLRRAHIEREFEFLNDMQRRAVFKTEGPLLLLAGAGSGKTTVIINRIANIIKYGDAYFSDEVPERITEMDVEILREYIRSGDAALKESAEAICALNPAAPWSIIAITFTNKAANELKERLERAVGERAGDIWAATFHSACVRILRRDIEKLGYSPSFTIYDATDSERVIKDVLNELNVDTKAFPPRAVQTIISRAKDSMLSPDGFEKDSAGNFRLEKIAEVYKRYQARLKAANALDFDDIIMLTVNLLSENRDVLDYYRRKFKYVLIDEYQDTNHAQYLLAALLAGGSGNICVVGDDDQSIYRFRGATIENILNFEEQFKNAETIRLEQNYRSTSKILDVANSVIKNNAGRKGKNLWTEKNDGELPIVFQAADEREEAAYIVDGVRKLRNNGVKFSDIAVLYRTNAQSRILESTFIKQLNHEPYIVKGNPFFERAEIKDILAYLHLIDNPADSLRLTRIINVPARKIGDKTINVIFELAAREHTYEYDIVRRANEFPELSRNAPALTAFAEMIDILREKNEILPLDELYDLVLDKTGYPEFLLSDKDGKGQMRYENIMELKSHMVEYMREAEDVNLTMYLQDIQIYEDLREKNNDKDSISEEGRVTLMTIHSAKGLEFPYVFICGLEDGLFPSLQSMNTEADIEEERRLFYVAATRAKKMLHMTYARMRLLFGQTKYGRVSRFISEIPEGLVEQKSLAAEMPMRSWSFEEGWGGDERRSERTPRSTWETPNEPRPKKKPSTKSFGASSFAGSAPSAPVTCNLSVGDRISHKAFKEGLVISVNPVGGDVLLEIAFDSVGTKRLLYKTAAKFITKI